MSNEADNTTSITSVRYYRLSDENARTFYDEWRFKTLAIIRKKGWDRPFRFPEEEIPGNTPAATDGADAIEMYKANEEAYDQVLMGCSGVVPLGLVRQAHGNVRNAIKYLDEKYAEQDESNLTQLLQEFTKCRLESSDVDPDTWFLQLDVINTKLASIGSQYEKKNYEMKAHLLGNLPSGYEDVRTKISGRQ